MSLSAKDIIDAVDGMSARDKQKVLRHLASAQGCTNERVIHPTEETSVALKKAVNGFMAFRSFHSVLFTGLQQKERSGFLTTLWDSDPYKAEWEFIAKIYSYVRNEVTKDNPSAQLSMRDFLDVACLVMNMVGVNDYLSTFNWQLIPNEDDHYELKQFSLPLIQKATPTMTGFDLFCSCLANGYNVQNGQNILFGMIGKPENLMTTASFGAFSLPAPATATSEPPTSFKNDFLGMISQNPLFAASVVIQDMVGHSPEVHGVNVLRVQDINQVPDELLRNRGSSSHYRQGSLSDLVRQYGDPSDTAELEFSNEVMGMGSSGNNNSNRSNLMASKNNTDGYDVIAALGADYIQPATEEDLF